MTSIRLISIGLALLCAQAISAQEANDTADHHAHEHVHTDAKHAAGETIVVTGSPMEHNPDELAIPVDRISRTEILDELGGTLGETLSQQPGITSTGFAAGSSRPVIRGQDAFRTEVLEDGLGTHDLSRLSPDHAVPINPLTAKRIEILRGPAALRYGGGATAGVVNALSQRVPSSSVGTAMTGELFGAWSNLANNRDMSFVLEGDRGPGVWHLDGLLRSAGDYETPDGPQPGSAYDTSAVSAGYSWLGESARVGFAYARYDSLYGIPEEDEDVVIDMRTNRYRVEADADEPVSGVRSLRFRSVYSDYEHDELAEGAVGQTFDNDEFEARLEALHVPLLDFVGALGIFGSYQNFSAGGEATEFLAPSRTGTFAFYFFEERPIHSIVDLELGFRVERTGVEGTPASGVETNRSFVPMSGSLAALIYLGEVWSVGLSGAITQRAPSDVELFARGPHEATGTFEIGDSRLDEETGYTGEIRLKGELGSVRLEVAQFVTRYDDYVYGDLTGATVDEEGDPVAPDDPGALDFLAYTAREALFYGGEVQLSANLFALLGGSVGADAQMDWVHATFQSGPGNPNVPRITPLRYGAGVFYEHDRFRARLSALHTEAQDRIGANETPTGSFTMLDLGVAYQLVFESLPDLELSLVAKNLLDQSARNHVAFNKDEVLLPGRFVRVGVRAEF